MSPAAALIGLISSIDLMQRGGGEGRDREGCMCNTEEQPMSVAHDASLS